MGGSVANGLCLPAHDIYWIMLGMGDQQRGDWVNFFCHLDFLINRKYQSGSNVVPLVSSIDLCEWYYLNVIYFWFYLVWKSPALWNQVRVRVPEKNLILFPTGWDPWLHGKALEANIQATCENGSRVGFDDVPCFSFPTLLEGVDFIKLLVCRLGNWFCFALDWGVGSVFSWEFSFPWFYKHTSTFQGAPIKP